MSVFSFTLRGFDSSQKQLKMEELEVRWEPGLAPGPPPCCCPLLGVLLSRGWGHRPFLSPVVVVLQAHFRGLLRSSGFHPLHLRSALNMFKTCPHLEALLRGRNPAEAAAGML